MAIDIYNSRRDYPFQCEWIKRLKGRRANQESFKREDKPTGIFFAREVQGRERASEIAGDVIDNPYQTTTLESQDHLSEMQKGDIVIYGNIKWIVLSVTRKQINKRCYFSNSAGSVYLIELRSGVVDNG